MIKYMDLLKNMENFHKIDGVVMIKTEYNNDDNFNFYIVIPKGWLFNVEKRENDVKCYVKSKGINKHFAINVNSVDSLLSTIGNYLNPPMKIKLKKTDDYNERVLETMGIIIDCLVDYVGNTEEIREIIGKRFDEAFE